VDFMESDWDLKRLFKKMLLSATYRQSIVNPKSLAKDPSNQWLARTRKKRLAAEMIRDNILFASGLLVDRVGGPSVKPYLPATAWIKGTYKADKGDKLYRRSLYTYWKRTSPPPNMIIFDAADRSICEVKRRESSTPLQALILLNDEQFVEGYKKLAERLVTAYPDDMNKQLIELFRVSTSRAPDDKELSIIKQLYREQMTLYAEEPKQAEDFMSVGESRVAEGVDPVKVASMASVVSLVMNFDEAVFKY